MEIILVRHALAMDRADFAKLKKDDSQRPLILKGKKRMLKVAQGLKALVPKSDLIITSPFLRALESAEILKRQYPRVKTEQVAELVPSAPPDAFINWLHSQKRKFNTIMVVGHEPHLSLFATYCLCGEGESVIELKKSGALCLSVDALSNLNSGTAQLKWLLPPKLF